MRDIRVYDADALPQKSLAVTQQALCWMQKS